ncbi:MAG: ribbon-helix-helix protein, CopG family [Armatimonadetes bacterium]|nr:ribbon-helix-helix protein, CopG family [Armatimonadota bacterium]
MRHQHLSVRVTESQKEALEKAAARDETTVGALVRRAVSNLLGAHPASTREPRNVKRTTARGSSRDREIAWLTQHRAELAHLRGQYLVIEGEALIAHGADLKAVIEQAREKGVRVPFVERIPDREDVPDFWMGL